MRKRNHVIPVRLNAKELRHLDESVSESGLSREEYLRTLIIGAEVRAKPCEHHADLLRKIAGLCNNANQLAHTANATGMAGNESVQEMLRISKETWQLVKEEW
ncbi:plasmid mobilization protein [Hespellia stercorisuis]|uniref:Mobilisation protein (MobC) n=1 Tax=Hespellia stercorisuis DSM 15480 TaxID=1121950 RepID=A0A1M6WCJ1_9FIRM|nr:plasmid mobilization relaxosome protein MobC [Hespellia stercorisuis]SHK91205.1 mobilisation protein (MobC) [Hespellia stercorisuis DSM 15480]